VSSCIDSALKKREKASWFNNSLEVYYILENYKLRRNYLIFSLFKSLLLHSLPGFVLIY
jgi:hypothetical protein